MSGNNVQDGHWRGDGSYYFSHYPHCWGWASWRRCWQQYDGNLSLWPVLKSSGFLETVFEDPIEQDDWSPIWDPLVLKGQPDTWDYQWAFTNLANEGPTALPNTNLVSNVGFGADGHLLHIRSGAHGLRRSATPATSPSLFHAQGYESRSVHV